MSFTLDPRPPVRDALREVALERLDRVLGELAGERSADRAKAIHEARKDLKRLRSLVRLLRPGLSKKAYRREADALRGASHALGDLREADALVETIDALRGPASGRVPGTTLDAVHDAFLAGSSAGAADPTDAVGAAATTLRAVRERVAAGALDVDGRTTLAAGLARTYERAHVAFATADADPTTDNLHDWRKRVKDLRYQQALLAPAWPAVLRVQAAEAKALSETLGDDHDLAELTLVLRDPAGALSGVPHDVDELLPVIETRRAELLLAARARGTRLHAERPKAFARRVQAYLDAPPLTD